jgi:hypothetical protein
MVIHSFENRNFMDPTERLGMHFFFEGRGKDFFQIFFVPNGFPSCSHYVPSVLNLFPKGVLVTPSLIPYVLPNLLPFSPI